MQDIKTITGRAINTTTIEWDTPRGAKCSITLLRNVELAMNGYLPAASHSIAMTVNGALENFWGLQDDDQLGFVVQARMSKASAQVPADKVDAIKSLIREYREHNDGIVKAEIAAEERYQEHHDAVERMRTTGRA